MLDETARRRPDFDAHHATWITLADGTPWAFPKPWLEIHATFQGGRAVGSRPMLTYGPELEELIEAIEGCRDNEALLVGAATLGAYLIRRNYDLDDRDLDRLFAVRAKDPSSWQWARELIDVATGTAGSRSFRDGSG